MSFFLVQYVQDLATSVAWISFFSIIWTGHREKQVKNLRNAIMKLDILHGTYDISLEVADDVP